MLPDSHSQQKMAARKKAAWISGTETWSLRAPNTGYGETVPQFKAFLRPF